MNSKPIGALYICRMAVFSSIILGLLTFFLPGTVVAADFMGSESCKVCHEKNFRDWSRSGHPYKLMKSEQARYRPIPLPMGITWDDVSYVIGGYKWKSRYIDRNGYIITTTGDEDGNPVPGQNQYDYMTGQWVDYHAGEAGRPYNCGSCHTTHWVADDDAETDNDLSDNQDGLPGMWGTFDAGGVHCEQCHGNGMTMTIDDSAAFCGGCHYRTSPPGSEVNSIPAKNGFINHHEQYNEFMSSPHSAMKCVDCHNPHERGEFSIWEDGESDKYPMGLTTGAQCGVNCHADKGDSFSAHAMADMKVECKDCHMPYASRSSNTLGPFQGDLQTHLMYISTDPNYNMFTDDGKFVKLDANGKGAVTLGFACKRCHATADVNELARFAKNFHNPDLAEVGFNPGLSGHWWGGPSRDGEGFLMEFSYSMGELVMIASFYTYDSLGNQIWLIAQGPVGTGTSVTLDVYTTNGAMWGDDFDPNAVNRVSWGTADFSILTCTGGTYTFTPNTAMIAEGFSVSTGTLDRSLTESKIQCPKFVNNPN